MSGWVRERLRAALAAAATLTGKRFGLLVASSLVATSAIVAAAATNQPEASPLASILGHSLAADRTPVAAVEPAPAAEPEAEPAPAVEGEATPAPAPSIVPGPEPEPTFVPEEAAPEPEPAPAEEPAQEAETPPPPPPPEAGRIKHVFIVSLVSAGYQPTFGKASAMPYLSGTLRPQGTLLGNYEVLDKATTPNGIAAISGQPPNQATKAGCPVFEAFPSTSTTTKAGIVTGEGCAYPVETQTLGDQLEAAGFSWRAYMEGMVDPTSGEPANCVYPATEPEAAVTGGYSSQLNPFAHFHSLLDLGACATDDVPITELKKDLKSEKKTANVSYVSPDLCSAGVAGQCPEGAPTGAAAADAWLEAVIPEIVESPAFKQDGLLIVAFGGVNPPEAAVPGAPAPAAPAKPLKTGALLISQFTAAGGTDPAPYDPYSLLRSTEELFGLRLLAKAADPKTKTFAPPLLGENGGD
ncbi:MAG TPA: alkaline phosphatase family protein [Solirubrobacterales bacterium]|nr:alkaline phosphatase family protein [Solirubrobacterales bacterium]